MFPNISEQGESWSVVFCGCINNINQERIFLAAHCPAGRKLELEERVLCALLD